tara:strand:- start:470 stop:940 length:471 start_codon:yes stop_codon:yes gene_type:complete
MSIKDVKIDLLVAVQRTQHCAHVEPIVDSREHIPSWFFMDWDEPDESAECPKCVPLKMSVGRAVQQLEQKSNGSRPLVMVSHMVKRNRRHRFAEPTDQDRVHNMINDDDMREWHRDGDPCFRSELHGRSSAFENHMSYTWEESDRMFHRMWHGEGG